MTPPPQDLSGDALGVLEGLAEKANAELTEGGWHPDAMAARIVCRELRAACTPSVILSLVARIWRAERTIKWLEDNAHHEIRIDRDGDDLTVQRWKRKYLTSHISRGDDLAAAVSVFADNESPSPTARSAE